MNRERFAQTMLILGVAFRETVSETLMTIYHDALDDLPENAVITAMQESIKTSTFFPRVAEIREIVARAEERERARDRARRIEADTQRRRLEVEQWRKDRASRPRIAAPVPIGVTARKLIDALTPEKLEARRAELQKQAEAISKDDEEGTKSGA